MTKGVSEEERHSIQENINAYAQKADHYYKDGDPITAAGIYQQLSEYNPQYGKLRQKIIGELKDNGDEESRAIIMGQGDKKQAWKYANDLYKQGKKEQAAYTLISAGNYRLARQIIAELTTSGDDEKAGKLALALLQEKEGAKKRRAALHYEEQQAQRKAA